MDGAHRGAHRRWWGIALFVVLMSTIIISTVHAEIYVYIDGEGVMHFTNTPTSSNYKLYMHETPQRPRTLQNIKSYDDVIEMAAKEYSLAFSLLKAVIHVESRFNPRAISKKGAMGLMQIMPENLGPLQISNPFDPWENVMGGARYLRAMLDRFDGQLPMALAAYNAGPTAVEKYQDIPPYPETQNYVDKVIRLFHIYRKS